MKILRAIGWVVVSGVLMAAAGGVTTRLLDRVWPRAASFVEQGRWRADAEAKPEAEPSGGPEIEVEPISPPEPEDENEDAVPANAPANPFWGHCCVTRDQLGSSQLTDMQSRLAARWPKLHGIRLDEIAEFDRVGFLVEVGSTAGSFAHELLTGTVVADEGERLIVGLNCTPQLRDRHGLSCEGLILVPRRAVLGWAKADSPEEPAELAPIDESPLVRHVEPGQPIELTVRNEPGTRWSVVPEDAAVVEVLEQRDNAATVTLRRAQPGELTLELTVDHELWGEVPIGRWPLYVDAGVS